MIKEIAFVVFVCACGMINADDDKFVMTRQQYKINYDPFIICDTFSASYIVKQQILNKKLILFATQPTITPREEKVNDFSIKIVIDPEIIRCGGLASQTGGYVRLHDLLLMDYAMNQYIHDNKVLGIYLIKTLAQISPDCLYKMNDNFYTFSQIIDKINQGEKPVLSLLECGSRQWENISKSGKINPDAYCYYEKYNPLVGSFASIYIVRQEAEEKNILIFATNNKKIEIKTIGNYSATVIINNPIMENNAAGLGSYNQQHNIWVCHYAAFQYLYGNKEYGHYLLKILSEAAPSMKMNVTDTTSMTIPEIVNSKTINEELVYPAAQWKANLSLAPETGQLE